MARTAPQPKSPEPFTRPHWRDAPPNVVRFIESRIHAPGFVAVAVNKAIAAGYRIDRADLMTPIVDLLDAGNEVAAKALAFANPDALKEERNAIARVRWMHESGWVNRNEAAEAEQVHAAAIARTAADEEWIARRAIELETQADQRRRDGFIAQARADLAASRSRGYVTGGAS